jgi:hypothetical protein
MLTQEYKVKDTNIKIEFAESLEDAAKHKFNENEYSRYLVNGKIVSYMQMINHIITESKNNSTTFMPDKNELKNLQQKMLNNQKNEIVRNLKRVKEEYKNNNYSQDAIDMIDKQIESLNLDGMKVKK